MLCAASSGPEAGGTRVTISGQHFEAVEAVAFGVGRATGVEVKSSTEIRAVAPPGTGTVNVSVVNPLNTSAVTRADQYTYVRARSLAAPAISRLQANAGPQGGGTRVMISGTNLQGATGVTFGTQKATRYTVLSASMISATSPATSSAGEVDVRVTTASGQSALGSPDRFSYHPGARRSRGGRTPGVSSGTAVAKAARSTSRRPAPGKRSRCPAASVHARAEGRRHRRGVRRKHLRRARPGQHAAQQHARRDIGTARSQRDRRRCQARARARERPRARVGRKPVRPARRRDDGNPHQACRSRGPEPAGHGDRRRWEPDARLGSRQRLQPGSAQQRHRRGVGRRRIRAARRREHAEQLRARRSQGAPRSRRDRCRRRLRPGAAQRRYGPGLGGRHERATRRRLHDSSVANR